MIPPEIRETLLDVVGYKLGAYTDCPSAERLQQASCWLRAQPVEADDQFLIGDRPEPDWEHRDRVCDWRNHVPEELREKWPQLHPLQRDAIAYMAEIASSNEEWE